MFRYSDLPSLTSFRVLVIHPGVGEEELQASILLDDLDAQKQDYEALSYFWGPPVFPQKIRVDGECLNITRTLYDALARLRLPHRERAIWAESVCIDQGSTVEKNHQVRLMSRIYTQCNKGLIYLGPEADGSEVLGPFFVDLSESLARDWSFDSLRLKDVAPWPALGAFLRRPWFRRLWVLQEFALPRTVIIICGHWAVDTIALVSLSNVLTYKEPVLDYDIHHDSEADLQQFTMGAILIRRYLVIRFAWQRSRSSAEPKLQATKESDHRLRMMDLIERGKKCEVTDPRDRFYALLGLAMDLEDDPNLSPDYDKDIREIRNAFFALIIRRGYGCDLLTRTRPLATVEPFRPSWMTLDVDDKVSYLDQLSSAILTADLIGTEFDRSTTAVSQISASDLAVRGFKVDRIHKTTTHELDLKVFDEALSFSPISSESFRRLVLRVLLQNKTHEGITPAPDEFICLCEVYLWLILAGLENLQSIPQILQQLPQKIDELYGLTKVLGHANRALTASWGSCFGVTNEGYYGMCHPMAKEGDQIFMIEGSEKTCLVRHQPDTNTYIWLGEIYVYDFEAQIQKCVGHEDLVTIRVT